MKNLSFILLLIFSINTLKAQSGDPKVDALLKQIHKQAGQISFNVKGQKFLEKASLVKNANYYSINGGFTDGVNPISLILPKLSTGKYELSTSKNTVLINNIGYAIKGTIDVKVVGGQITGSFSGNLFEISNKSSSPNQASSGTITGTFSGLLTN
ncbi:MAG: hypothetical protein V4585_12900 [Bacteroidota bacterium]